MAGKTNIENIGVLILAAGGSSRLGKPKQLLAYNGKTLLQHAVQTAIDSTAQPIVVVLGAESDTIVNELTDTRVHTVVNEAWQEGMASSIRCGINEFMQTAPNAEGAILMVCDQPYVTAALLNELATAHRKSGKQIVASGYDDTFGPPVFFHKSFFNELLQLKGDIGARSIVRQHTALVEVVSFPEGTFDVDTEADYEQIKKASR